MTRKQHQKTHVRTNAKSMLGTLRTTTAIGAVSLTLAGWGVLSHAEATNAALAAANAQIGADAASLAVLAQPAGLALSANQASSDSAPVASAPTATQIVPATSESVSLPTPTATPSTVETKIKLDVVQWVQTTTGDVVAVVRDARGTLWYVWESDVTLIEQGLSPVHQPIPVNQQGRTRGS